MDGTIVDTEPSWGEAEHALIDEFGGRWTDADAVALIGTPLPRAAEILRGRGVRLPADEIVERLLGHVVRRVREGRVAWRPGARELLSALRAAGVPSALVTMSFQPLADAVIDLLPPGTFEAVVTGEVVEQGKPHPEPYLRAAAALRVDPGDAVAIEDSLPGVTSAQSAGVPVVAVQHIVPLPAERGRVVLTTLEGVTPDELGRLARRIRLRRPGRRPGR
jgi:HAD superfamily hydrolase (TIGR01509 family)